MASQHYTVSAESTPGAASPQAQDRQARRREISARLDSALDEVLADGSAFRRWLDLQAKFHRYSFANCMMIAMQCRDATQVAGYRRWQELGRYVRKGEHAIYIWAPSMYKRRPKAGEPEPDADAEPEYVRGFVLVPVFDVAQTDGEPLPDLNWRAAGDAPAALADALGAAAVRLGFALGELAADDEADGRARHETRELLVKPGLAGAQMARTLAHELAHLLLHGDAETRPRARELRELEADSAAYIALAHFGLDCAVNTAEYIAAYLGESKVKLALKQCADSIAGAAEKIIDAVETALAAQADAPALRGVAA